MKALFLSLLLATVGVSPAAAAEPRKPTARWVINYDDAQCVATRNYGTAAKPLFLAFKPSARGSVMRVMMIRRGSAVEPEQRPAVLQFDGQPPIAVNALAHGDPRSGQYIAAITVPMATFAANRRAATLSFNAGNFDERLAVPGLVGVAAAFDDCLANLRRVWNVESAEAGRLKKSARPLQPLGNLFKPSSYPPLARQEENSGAVGVTLLVDEVGKVRDCMIEETSGFPTLDTMSCHVISEGAKFTPALGEDGKAAKSAVFQRIRWRMRV